MVKTLKSFIPTSKSAPLKLCKVPTEGVQNHFGGPIYNEKNQEVYFIACIDRFSKFPTAEVFDSSNADNFLKFLQEYVLLHGIPRSIRLDQARCQTVCNQNYLKLQYTTTEQSDLLKANSNNQEPLSLY